MDPRVFVALGSNLGDRRRTLGRALESMAGQGIELVACSDFIQTEPVGGPPGQGPYLNAVAEIRTDLPPEELLERLGQIEADCGRDRATSQRWGPRTCDLDILLYGDRIVETPDLQIPHPRMRQRRFVLQPLCQVAPDVVDPQTGRTAAQLLEDLDAPEASGS
ncbi:MAG: 2-amino-4-hydroxy-6-hydroxymethyldihydropteridine diphosphokinase [Planctomycetota bacterium]